MVNLLPYATVRPLMGPLQSWLGPDDAVRLEAYSLYEAMYKNIPEAFKLTKRGSEAQTIYVPSAKTIVEATTRYLAKGWTYTMDPKLGTDQERADLDALMQQLFRREKIWSKFAIQKRYGLIRGDQVWHVVADPTKEPGRRVSIYSVDPAAYFPIVDDWQPDKLYGVHLVTPVMGDDGKTVIKRQTYRKEPTGRISYELSWWQVGAWDDRDGGQLKKAEKVPEGDFNKPTKYELDPRITAIPVYHIKNNEDTGNPFGTSELAGLESIIQGVNQSISDEDLALALEGLGLYATTSGPPVDDDGNETNWRIGPGWVVEIDEDSTFERINGVSSVEPYQTHIGSLRSFAHESAGIPDVAVGGGDVTVMESGIALAFRMSPMLAKNEEKEQEILSVMDHLLYDLATMWFPTYEQLDNAARPVSIVDDPMPVNRAAVLEEIVQMLSTDPPLISAEYARQLMAEKLGYEFPDEMGEAVVTEAAALADARNVDPFAGRVAAELEDQQQ